MRKYDIKPGQRYIHYKTQHVYEVKDIAHCTDNRGLLVIYSCVSGADTRRWARRIDEFIGKVTVPIPFTNKNKVVRRFKKVE